MNNTHKVIWYEGMFLQPQHFQQQEKYLEHMVNQRVSALQPHAWGFSELELDEKLYSLNKIGIARAKGVFADGTPFHLHSENNLPTPFSVKQTKTPLTLHLCLPLRQAAAFSELNKPLSRYRARTIEIHDLEADNEQSTEVQLGYLACEIRSDQDDLSNYVTLPFATILQVIPDQGFGFDQTFIPPCLDAAIAPTLWKIVLEIHRMLKSHAFTMTYEMNHARMRETMTSKENLLFAVIKRYEALFHYYTQNKRLHPEQLFVTLIQLRAEISTFYLDTDRPAIVPLYCHHALWNSIHVVAKEIEFALDNLFATHITSISLKKNELGIWLGNVDYDQIHLSAMVLLAISGTEENESLLSTLPAQTKIAPAKQLPTLIQRALPAIPLQAETTLPQGIPFDAKRYYFSLDISCPLWTQLENDPSIAVHIGGEDRQLTPELWVVQQ